MPIERNKEQFECLGSIGNYHLTPYPDSNSNVPKLIDPKSHIGYNRHILHNPYAMSQKSNPTSPRNRLMYYLSLDESSVPETLVWHYLKVDSKEIRISTPYSIQEHMPEDVPKRPRKKRKLQKRIVSVSLSDINRSAGQDPNELLNCANPNHTLYKRFKEEMVMEGILRWHHHDESLDICVMTDYNPLNGNIVPGSFVHVTKQQNYISCECDVYKHLRGIAI